MMPLSTQKLFLRATATTFEPITDASMKYSTELFGDEVVSLVHRHPAGTPLFIYAPFEAVHGASSCYVAGKPPDCKSPDGDELQAPARFIQQQGHIKQPDRRTFAGMLGALDEAVGNITTALEARGMLENTIILFTTDNGAPDGHFDKATMSNWPLRGGKATLWEGGVRGTSFIWGKGVPSGVNNTKLFHAADWLPTFAAVAGVSLPAHKKQMLDGHNIWPALTSDAPSPRKEIVHNIDPDGRGSALRVGEYKLIIGQRPTGWGPNPSESNGKYAHPDPHDKGPWLFNVRDDPSEYNNLYNDPKFADQKAILETTLSKYRRSAAPCTICGMQPDPKAAPPIVKGLNICTPAPKDPADPTQGPVPILCGDLGVWQPWNDHEV